MPSYSISLNTKLNQVAVQAASESVPPLDAQTYLNKIVKEHLTKYIEARM